MVTPAFMAFEALNNTAIAQTSWLVALAGDTLVGTMTRGTGTIKTLKDSTLYQQEQTWAHWRVAVENKPADTRRKYRGQG